MQAVEIGQKPNTQIYMLESMGWLSEWNYLFIKDNTTDCNWAT